MTLTTEMVTVPSDGWMLHGIVHSPTTEPESRIGVVLFHENINTKFGTHGLYRRLAESLAAAGFYVLRYDNRGTCDSSGLCDLTFAHRVADARAALEFFRKRRELDTVVGWGLCMGAAVAVHCAAQEKLDALVLCNILADPADASLPKYGYNKVDLPGLARDMFFDGKLLRKLWQAPRKLHLYRKNLPKLAATLLERYRKREPELDRLRKEVGRVGELLARYSNPCLMIFGEMDTYRASFFERVNPGDRLGLAGKKIPPDWATVKQGDHTFASAEQTAEMIRYMLDWLNAFRARLLSSSGRLPLGERHGISAAPVTD